ncbi:methylamine utilization protein [Methylophaga sp. SB9B]|uniref:methylamine utilization protein n=1 Tax=Methylophaga sp. SB9B TaxID=2570356 RepID=UPI0020004D36|nr:methylamine utilization protein [Methylophaga sp. SB9B]
MRSYLKIAKSTLLCPLILVSPVQASAVTLNIIDQHQQPVANAVIEILNSAEIKGSPTNIAVIDQINKAFVPEQIIIQQGQAVDFPNSDNIRHHVYSFSEAKTFELKLYADKPEKEIVFEQPGVVVVGCNIHDSMIGYIYVAEHQFFTSSDLGVAHIAASAESSPQISIWHPYAANGAESRQTFEVNQLEKNATGEYIVEIELTPPPPRDSFEDTFGAIGHH